MDENNLATEEHQVLPSFDKRLAALTPYTPAEEPQRYYGGCVAEFIPSKEYGRVYPYVGRIQSAVYDYSDVGEVYWFPYSLLYGFVDQSGRIICDPVYRELEVLSYADKKVYVAHKTVYPHGLDDLDDYMTMMETEYEEHYIVISLDGSFFEIFDEVFTTNYYLEEKPTSYEFIAVKKDGLWGVIDYEGNTILSCQYFNPPLFSEGLAAVYINDPHKLVYDRKRGGHYSDYTYCYIDENGNQVLGPFSREAVWGLNHKTFSHGRALITSSNDYVSGGWNDEKNTFNPNIDDMRTFIGFLDKKGLTVVPEIYASTGFLVNIGQRSYQKGYDKNGLAIVSVANTVRKEDDWKIGIEYDNNSTKYGIIDINGDYALPLRKTENAWGEWDIRQEGNYYFVNEKEIFVYKEGKLTFVKNNEENIHYKACLEGDIFTTNAGIINVITNEIYYSGETPHVVRRWSGGPWGAPYGGSEVVYLDNRPCVYGYLWNWDDSYLETIKFGVLGINSPVLDFKYDFLKWVEGYFCVVEGDYGGLIKPDGSWFVKVYLKNIND